MVITANSSLGQNDKYKSMRISINNIQLNVIEQGSGPLTLVLLHYFGGSAMEWQSVMAQLSDRYRCIAIDLRGHGDSDSPETGYSVDDMADDVAAVLREKNTVSFVLIGHSMSGKVAMALAARQPSGLQSLLLLSPSPPLPEPIPDEDRQKMLRTYGQREAAEDTFRQITEKPLPEAAHAQIVADNLRTANVAWNAWLLEGSKENIAGQMPFITVPVHLLVGTNDRAVKPGVSETMTMPYLPTATFETVAGAGHLLPWETPDTVVDFIQKKIALDFA